MANKHMIRVGDSPTSMWAIEPDPAALTWGLQDVSAADAGRTQSGQMYKMQISQKVTLDLTWTFLTPEQSSSILRAFSKEYVWVQYFDPMNNGWRTAEFYTGDRSAPFQWFQIPNRDTLISQVKFKIIER